MIEPLNGFSRTAVPIVDCLGRIIAILAGRPDDQLVPAGRNWDKAISDAVTALKEARTKLRCNSGSSHRRGDFFALTVGLSYGGGQTKPGNLVHNKTACSVLDQLLSHPSFIRISGFSNGVFALWVPKLQKYYSDTLGSLYLHDNALH